MNAAKKNSAMFSAMLPSSGGAPASRYTRTSASSSHSISAIVREKPLSSSCSIVRPRLVLVSMRPGRGLWMAAGAGKTAVRLNGFGGEFHSWRATFAGPSAQIVQMGGMKSDAIGCRGPGPECASWRVRLRRCSLRSHCPPLPIRSISRVTNGSAVRLRRRDSIRRPSRRRSVTHSRTRRRGSATSSSRFRKTWPTSPIRRSSARPGSAAAPPE